MILYIANAVALVASLLMIWVGLLHDKKKMLIVQSIQIALFILSNLLLGGYSGAIVNLIGLVRNIYCYYGKLKIKEMIFFSLLTIIFSILYNNLGIIGLLPAISTIVYIFFMNTKSIIKFKVLIIFTAFCWFIYDIFIKSYTSSIFDLATIIASIYVCYKEIKKTKRKKRV